MISALFDNYGILTDFVHLSFLTGIIVGFIYFRRRRVSIGGTLAIGYLASSLYAPLNVLATIAVALVAFLLIRLVILKVFLPRPRQIFAIGLAVGVVLDAAWIAASTYFFPGTAEDDPLQLVGVIVPGMLCNSLVKQGVAKTLIPLAWMVPLSGAIGLAAAWLVPLSVSNTVFAPRGEATVATNFALSAASVIFAVIIQESTVRSVKLRTAGYVTAGVLASSMLASPIVLAVIAVVVALVAAVWIPYSRRTPLFGKDRFFILLMLSFTFSITAEIALYAAAGTRFDGPQNIVFTVLPAIIVNDLVQYGPKRTAAGFGLSAAGCTTLATSITLFA
ncbi:poly-gamma-glutamate biosynthesis protein PgsC/CapC [Corynebacterium liangguodongii]|uniref:Uncharacterized protein n=1 Tax=Corynebacterium liangguodongii TaxID=2079535 RepID=A0A2S0WDD5_9CORY|nr:poly-gamma-glutamate biosynthesis protein PgsC/CapC [Corynebacterium liangguodongii]AWB83754.1 hypothetical protein C3E79_04015 [Corynebacterium liangguodongii]PWB99436.1 hypothetical protein DF219_05780 [Corynebacterium liangguodongii]